MEGRIYHTTEFGTLYLGDAISVLKELDKNSVDMAIIDPPYVIYPDERAKNKEWEFHEINWNAFAFQLNRVMKDTGIVFMFGNIDFFILSCRPMLRFFKVPYHLIWEKTNPIGFFRAKLKPMPKDEIIAVFIKKDATLNDTKYYPERVCKYSKPYVRHRSGYSHYGGVELTDTVKSNGIRHPTSIIVAKNKPNMQEWEKTEHPTQKPLELYEFFVLGYSDEGDVILDPFIGSGTTAIVCEKYKRRWIGIEINEKWCELVVRRLQEIKETPYWKAPPYNLKGVPLFGDGQ